MRAGHAALSSLKIMDDPEAIFQMGRLFCDVGDFEEGLEHLQRAVRKGYFVVPTLSRAGASSTVSAEPRRSCAVLAEAEEGHGARPSRAFREAGGERLLGAVG